MTLYHYVAEKNPIGAKKVLNSFGEKAVPRPDILAKQLANCVNQHGKECLYRIAAVHPDLDLVSQYYLQATRNEHTPCECDKCTKEAEKESVWASADGQEIKKTVEEIKNKQEAQNGNAPKTEKSESKDLMILGVVAVIALALVMKK